MPADLDPALARAWREASGDEPPERVDDAIRAAARRAVQAGPRPAERSFVQRWRVPLSIAALIVVSASLTLMMSERDAHLPLATKVPAPGPAAEQGAAREAPAAAAAGKPGPPPARAIAREPASAEAARAQRYAPAGGATAPQAAARASGGTQALERKDGGEPAAPAESDSLGAAPVESPHAPGSVPSEEVDAPTSAAPPARTEPPPAAREEAAPAGGESARTGGSESTAEPRQKRESASDLESIMREPLDSDEEAQPPGRARLKLQARPTAPAALGNAEPAPEQWIERIRELRRQGLAAEAEASLKRFRERYPEFALPADLAAPGEH
jgi:hypothetical protein